MPEPKYFLISSEVLEAIPAEYWLDYGGPPAHLTELNGYVLAYLDGIVENKVELFRGVSGVQEFSSNDEVLAFKEQNPSIFNLE